MGSATACLFALHASKTDLKIFDIVPEKCVGCANIGEVAAQDIVFVCVPTPTSSSGACNVSYVEQALGRLRAERSDCAVVVRSTVPPGFCAAHSCAFMPEFLTEKNWREDVRACPLWILGVGAHQRELIEPMVRRVLQAGKASSAICSDELSVISTTSAEVVKYARNVYLAAKVGLFNEYESFCKALSVPFEEVRCT